MPIKIHQFHSGSAYGDAVTNSMLLLQDHLRDLGFTSEIFVQHLDSRLADVLRPHAELPKELGPEDILIVQHSMGHDLLDWVLSLESRKVLMYHNITPAEFFSPESDLYHYSIVGRQQLKLIKNSVEHAFAVSEYNAVELRALGFKHVDILPVLVRHRHYSNTRKPKCLENSTGRPWTVLFVGRVCENKGHQDLVSAAEYWVKRYPGYPIQFICVGNVDINSNFYEKIRERIDAAGLGGTVQFTGMVSDAELAEWYARADCYLSLSRHEGFGVPLIEAMLCDLPVVALDAAAVAETLGSAGLLLDKANPENVTGILFKLMRNRLLRRKTIAKQRLRSRAFSADAIRVGLQEALRSLGVYTSSNSGGEVENLNPQEIGPIRVEGPCDSSYSLAIVNRELAQALDRSGRQVRLFCTEGPGDYVPEPRSLDKLESRARELIASGNAAEHSSLCIRNLYPPRVRDARGDLVSGYFFWEESAFPSDYVADFNLSLDVLLAPSRFVADVWRSSGVNVPIRYVGTGADHVMRYSAEQLPIELPEGFRFLHISSCFPRKGPDVLLRAWGRAFAGRSDIHLIIKSFPNPHNEVPALLQSLRESQKDYPPVTLLMDDYTPGQLAGLYEACDAYVAPSRGEGFGLPMAEAMLHSLPVIATGWGGHVDFCNEETAFPIRYRLAPSSSHVAGSELALWAEPDEEHLVELLREVESDRSGEVARKTAYARETVLREYNWDAVAARVLEVEVSVEADERDFSQDPLRLAWVSTWNEPCGIATYSKYLLENLQEAEVTLRLYGRISSSLSDGFAPLANYWRDAADASLEELGDALLADDNEVAVIQFNFGFFNVHALGALVRRLESSGMRVVLVLHSTRDVNKPNFRASLREASGLEHASRILVHSLEDLNRLIEYGFGHRAVLFPHGAMETPNEGMHSARQQLQISAETKIIASYGFMLPHKGLPELVEAFAEVCKAEPNAYLFMVNSLFPDPVSGQLQGQLIDRLDRLNIRERVRIFTDFLPEQAGLTLLRAANLVVFPYQHTAESASGAVRFGLAAHRPVACTPLPIFSDLDGQGLRFRGCQPHELAADLTHWLADDDLNHVIEGQDAWVRARSWPRLMVRLTDLFRGLVLDSEKIPASK